MCNTLINILVAATTIIVFTYSPNSRGAVNGGKPYGSRKNPKLVGPPHLLVAVSADGQNGWVDLEKLVCQIIPTCWIGNVAPFCTLMRAVR